MFWSKSSVFTEKVHFCVLALFMSFPVIDYILRNKLPIPVLSSLWDELMLAGGLVLVSVRLIFGDTGRRTRLTKPILAMVLAGAAYLILDLTTLSINIEGFRAMFQYMFVFFVAFYLTDRPEQARDLLSVLVVIGFLMALFGIYQWIVKAPMLGRWIDATEAVRTRVFSITTSPNALGSQMAMLTPIALGLFMQEKNWAKKILWLGAAGAMAVCLVFTFSRGAWLAFAGAIALTGILYDRRILIAGVIAGIIAVIFVPAVNQRIAYLFTPEYLMKSAQSGRISRWLEAYDQMRNNPLFGVGLGHFGGAVASRHYGTFYVDNYYIKTLAEMGLVGLSLFLWLILTTLKEGYVSMKRLSSPRLRFMAAGMFAGLLAIVLHNGVENIFEIPYLNIYFWLVAGLLAALPFNSVKTATGNPTAEGGSSITATEREILANDTGEESTAAGTEGGRIHG